MDYDKSILITLARGTARGMGLDPILVCALIEQESNWNCWAMRFEPMFLAHYVKPALPEAPTTGEIARATSWGLMQIMGQVALEFGFQGKFYTELCDPSSNIFFGCRKLAKCLESRDSVKGALLMWNGGGNPAYADQVLARMKNYQPGV